MAKDDTHRKNFIDTFVNFFIKGSTYTNLGGESYA
jgi:hypothetical protein